MQKKFYRLLCLQGTGYMATGYNATSKEELADDYASYKDNDWDDEMRVIWKGMSLEDKLDYIESDEFEIEEGDTAFDEKDIH